MNRKEYLKSIGKLDNGKIKYTFTTRFLLPILGYNVIEDFLGTLINVHIGSNLITPELIVVLENNTNVSKDIVRCRINSEYVEDILDNDEVIIKFKIPAKYLDVYTKFIKGEYSKFDTDYKQKLKRIYSERVFPTGTNVSMWDILNPMESKRKAIADKLDEPVELIVEVFDKPDLDYEIYKSIIQLKSANQIIHE